MGVRTAPLAGLKGNRIWLRTSDKQQSLGVTSDDVNKARDLEQTFIYSGGGVVVPQKRCRGLNISHFTLRGPGKSLIM